MDGKITARIDKGMGIQKPNILYFGHYGLSEGIGGSARLKNMLDVLRKLEADTQLISYLPEKKFKVINKEVSNYLNTTTICVPSASPKIFKVAALLLIFIFGLRYIRKRNIIFAHGPNIVYGFPALILAKTFGKPLLIDFTDNRDPATPEFIYRFILRNSSAVFAVSHYLEEAAKKAGSRNVVHAPGFIDASAFQHNAAERKRIREELNIGDNEVAIGYAGAFSPDEGLSFLLRAFKSLSKRHGNIRLVLLGGRNAPGLDDIPGLINELNIKEKVITISPQPYELMPAYLSAFDIACSPKIDCLANRCADPIKVYEYMAVGLPTVASAVSETTYVIENGFDGFLVKPEDADDLAGVLEHVIQNLGSFRELRRKAREKVIDNYTQEVVLKKLEKTLENLLTKHTK